MGLIEGAATFARFRPQCDGPGFFGAAHMDQLRANALGENRDLLDLSSGISIGWGAGTHYGDREFTGAKQLIGDGLFAQVVAQGNKYPAEKLRSYYQTELRALQARYEDKRPLRILKKEAKEAAAERLKEEGSDGRFLRRKSTDFFWDGRTNEVLLGSTSRVESLRARILFLATFGADLTPVSSGELARNHIDDAGLADIVPTMFHDLERDAGDAVVKWTPAVDDRDFLGNEFLLWLWFQCDRESATIRLPDASEATVFFSKTLTLEDPRGSSGRDTFTHEGPARLPEAFRGIQLGKLPRKVGLTVVRADVQYSLTLNPEAFTVTGAKIPFPEEDGLGALELAAKRTEDLRDLREIIDGLFAAYCADRFSLSSWAKMSARIMAWLTKGTE